MITTFCKYCGKQFEAADNKKKYCSDECVNQARRERKRKNITYQPAHCKICGKMFTPERKNQVCCSSECGKANRVKHAKKQYKKKKAEQEDKCKCKLAKSCYFGGYLADHGTPCCNFIIATGRSRSVLENRLGKSGYPSECSFFLGKGTKMRCARCENEYNIREMAPVAAEGCDDMNILCFVCARCKRKYLEGKWEVPDVSDNAVV